MSGLTITADEAREDPDLLGYARRLCHLGRVDPSLVTKLYVDRDGVSYFGYDFDHWDRRNEPDTRLLAFVTARTIAARQHPANAGRDV